MEPCKSLLYPPGLETPTDASDSVEPRSRAENDSKCDASLEQRAFPRRRPDLTDAEQRRVAGESVNATEPTAAVCSRRECHKGTGQRAGCREDREWERMHDL